VQVSQFVGVQAQRRADGVQNLVRDAIALALFQPRVVGDAHTRQASQLLTPQARDPAHSAVAAQTDVLRAQAGTA
jgi:hypothetical protein